MFVYRLSLYSIVNLFRDNRINDRKGLLYSISLGLSLSLSLSMAIWICAIFFQDSVEKFNSLEINLNLIHSRSFKNYQIIRCKQKKKIQNTIQCNRNALCKDCYMRFWYPCNTFQCFCFCRSCVRACNESSNIDSNKKKLTN